MTSLSHPRIPCLLARALKLSAFIGCGDVDVGGNTVELVIHQGPTGTIEFAGPQGKLNQDAVIRKDKDPLYFQP